MEAARQRLRDRERARAEQLEARRARAVSDSSAIVDMVDMIVREYQACEAPRHGWLQSRK